MVITVEVHTPCTHVHVYLAAILLEITCDYSTSMWLLVMVQATVTSAITVNTASGYSTGYDYNCWITDTPVMVFDLTAVNF